MSGASSARTIIESFARPSPLIRESASIAFIREIKFRNGIEMLDRRKIDATPVPSHRPLPPFLRSTSLAVGDTPELLTRRLLFQNHGRVITRTRFCSRAQPRRRGRRKEEEGQSAFQRAAKTSEIEIDRWMGTQRGGKVCAELWHAPPPSRISAKSIEIHAIIRARRGRGGEGERERLFVV